MFRYFSFLLVGVLAIALVGCGDAEDASVGSTPTAVSAAQGDPTGETESGNRISVIATTAQIAALVQEIAGDQVDLHVLMPSGVDPHDYEVTPDDLRAIGDADLILKNGIGLDDFLDDSIEAAGGDAETVTVTDGVELIEGGHHAEDEHGHEDEHDEENSEHEHEDEHDEHEDEDGHDHGEFDAHVWHDPANAMLMVDNIVAALTRADAGRADMFKENGDAYKTVLEETDAEIRALLDEIPEADRKLVTTHDAFGYFIHAYGFEFVGAVIPGSSTDAEPSAREIAELSDLINRENVKAVFAEETVDPSIAEQLANDTGVEIVYGLHSDSLGEPGSGAETIHGMLLANATKISEALR